NEMYLWGAYQLAGEVETAFQHGEQAKAYFEKALKIARTHGMRHLIADDLGHLSGLEWRSGNISNAISLQRQGFEIFNKLDSTRLQAVYSCLTLAWYYRAAQDYARSLEFSQQAQRIATAMKQQDSSALLAGVATQRALTYEAMGDAVASRQSMELSLRLAAESQRTELRDLSYLVVDVYTSAGQIEKHLGNKSQADKHLRAALELALKYNLLDKANAIRQEQSAK
ncbi:MAG: hypothetical protein K2Z81_16885, partial [Cyanobacteria bacterium]|nr:hypothetical protein [Cyanobacteriota bacterium]